MSELLKRYGFQDKTGCVNHRDATAFFTDEKSFRSVIELPVPDHMRDMTGIGQLKRGGGNCWMTSMLAAAFANPRVRDIVSEKMPQDMRDDARVCMQDMEAAKRLRSRMWYDYKVGDNVERPGYEDGRNGYSEFAVLFSKLGIPQLIFREDGGQLVPGPATMRDRSSKSVSILKPKDPCREFHFLTIRFEDGDHQKFPAMRRIRHEDHDVRYRLLALVMGQRDCGHQISLTCTSPTGWRDWMIADADMHTDGIGPTFVKFEGDEYKGDAWWKALEVLVHVTKFGMGNSQLCFISPHNRNADGRPGSNSIDMIYVPVGCE